MDHSFHLLNSVQGNLLRHLQVIYSTVIAQNNVVSLQDSRKIWIINIRTPQPKSFSVQFQNLKKWFPLLCEYEGFNFEACFTHRELQY